MTRRTLIWITLAATMGCTTTAAPTDAAAGCPDAGVAMDTAPPPDTAPDTAVDAAPDADADAGSSCPGTLVLFPVSLSAMYGRLWANCDDAPTPPMLSIQVYRDGVLEQDIELPCGADALPVGRFAPGRLEIAASWNCLGIGREIAEPEACAHEPDETRPVSCAPTIVELEPCETQPVALALRQMGRCPPR